MRLGPASVQEHCCECISLRRLSDIHQLHQLLLQWQQPHGHSRGTGIKIAFVSETLKIEHINL